MYVYINVFLITSRQAKGGGNNFPMPLAKNGQIKADGAVYGQRRGTAK